MKQFVFTIFFVFGFTLVIHSQQTEVVDGKKFIVHQVEKGNTLYSIAKQYNVNLSDILNNNPDTETGIKIGQKIYIPIIETTQEQSQGKVETNNNMQSNTDTSSIKLNKFHIVEKQETLYSISKKYNVTIYDLVKINPGIEAGIQIGQQVIIPDVLNQSSDVKSLDIIYYDTVIKHTVMKSETLYSISKRYMVSQKEIMAYNGMKTSALQPNTALYIPLKKENLTPVEVREVPNVKVEADDSIATNEFVYKKKDAYKIILSLPLGLSNVKEKYKTIATEFYMGAEYALDSLRKLGLNADVHVIDCSVDSASYMRELSKFKNADLIIGPFEGGLLDKTAKFSKENEINMINPLVGYSKPLEGNPYLINAMTSDINLIKGLAKYLATVEENKRIILVKPSEKDMPLYNAFREVLYSINSENGIKFIETTSKEIPTYFTKGVDHVIFYPSRSQNEVKAIMNVIQQNVSKIGKGDVIIYGTKEWTNMEQVKEYYKNTYHFHFGMANDFDYKNENTIRILRGIRSKYNTDLTKFMAQGFDVAYYFISKFCMDTEPKSLIMNDFNLKKISPSDGTINTTIYVYEQKDFEYILLKKVN